MTTTSAYYTGTLNQPDTVTFFYLERRGPIHFTEESIVNSKGYSPLNFMTAIERIGAAVAKIFRENSDLWNAFGNLFRGVVQLVPIAGNGALYVWDCIKAYYDHRLIYASLDKTHSVMGIAFDGKIVATFPPTAQNPSNALDAAKRAWLLKLNDPAFHSKYQLALEFHRV